MFFHDGPKEEETNVFFTTHSLKKRETQSHVLLISDLSRNSDQDLLYPPVSQVQVQADRAAAVPLAALVSALHPLDQPGGRGRRGRQLCASSTSWCVSTSIVADGGSGESPGGARPGRHQLLQGWEGGSPGGCSSKIVRQRGSEGAVPRLPSPLTVEDGVDVERLSPRLPCRPVPP